MRIFQLYVDENDFKRLEEIAGRGSVAALVRKAIKQWLWAQSRGVELRQDDT